MSRSSSSGRDLHCPARRIDQHDRPLNSGYTYNSTASNVHAASTALDDAVRRSIAAGVTYAIAAGNSNTDVCTTSPARVSQALAVGSSTSGDARSSFSNFGICVDLFAPGSRVTSAWSTSDTAINTISGTSMAAPRVAGVAALYLSGDPAAPPNVVHAAVVNNASVNRLTSIGTGSPNRLLYSIFGSAPPSDAAPTATFTFSCSGLTCTFDAADRLTTQASSATPGRSAMDRPAMALLCRMRTAAAARIPCT